MQTFWTGSVLLHVVQASPAWPVSLTGLKLTQMLEPTIQFHLVQFCYTLWSYCWVLVEGSCNRVFVVDIYNFVLWVCLLLLRNFLYFFWDIAKISLFTILSKLYHPVSSHPLKTAVDFGSHGTGFEPLFATAVSTTTHSRRFKWRLVSPPYVKTENSQKYHKYSKKKRGGLLIQQNTRQEGKAFREILYIFRKIKWCETINPTVTQ
jgi:hypothetical protein